MSTVTFDWKRFHAYRVFDEFLERFIIQRRSYVTRHEDQLDLQAAFEDIRSKFIDGADESDAKFERKVARQFHDASAQTKIVFANVEYLWAMPVENITPQTKRSYALRWFSESNHVVSGESYFFGDPHIIADAGRWYTQNKYWELVAALRVLSLVTSGSGFTDLTALKKKIAEICHAAIYEGVPSTEKFAVYNSCGIHSVLMHLADPDHYEAIISASHRRQICAVFGHVVESPSGDPEILIKKIRDTLYKSYGVAENSDTKYRWFFYTKDVLPLWIRKKTKKAQQLSSIVFDVRMEEDAADLEGDKEEVKGYRLRRSAKLAKGAKVRDRYTCRACDFHFEDQIVHVHHLDPLSEYQRPKDTRLADLVTLCPTCHYLAHYWLRKSDKFKQLDHLLSKLSP